MTARSVLRHLLNTRAGFDEAAACALPVIANTLAPAIPSEEAGAVWKPPLPSMGSRRPTLRGKGSVRGSLVDETGRRELVFESRLERGLAEMLLARHDVREVRDQPPPVTYVDASGRTRTHTFDFLAATADGRRVAFAVKPLAKVEHSGIMDTIALIRAQMGSRFADSYLLRTDRHITPDKVFNARLLLRSRRCRNEDDMAAIWAIAGNLPGTFKLADIVTQSKIGARGFNAIVALIDSGRLEPVGSARIGYLSSLRRAA